MLQNLPRTYILQVAGQDFVLFGLLRHQQLHGSLSPELRSLDPGLGTSSISILPFFLSCKHARDVHISAQTEAPPTLPTAHMHTMIPRVLGIMVPRKCLNQKLKDP